MVNVYSQIKKQNWLGIILLIIIILFILKSCGTLKFDKPIKIPQKSFDTQEEAEEEALNVACFGSHLNNITKKYIPCKSDDIYIYSIKILGGTLENDVSSKAEGDLFKPKDE